MAGLSTNARGLWGGFAGLLYGSTSLSTPPGFLADAPPAWVPDGGVLAFEFDNGLGYNSVNPNKTTPDSILTYTNPSPKLVYGDDGVLRYAPHNLLTYSEQFNDASWVKTNQTVTSNAASAPDGSQTADLLTVVSASNSARHNFTAVSGNPYTFSVYVKAGTAGWGLVQVNDFLNDAVQMWINLSTGAIGTVKTFGTWVPLNPTSESVGNGWYRVSVAGVVDTTVNVNGSVAVASADNVATGVVGANILAWGGQVTNGVYPLAYIPTTTAAVYSLPIDHNPTTFEPLGVLIEEQRTNLCLYSDDFTNAAWTPTNLTTAKTATGPDGVTNSASTLTATAANATARQNVTSASAARITSMFVKRRTGTGAVYLSQGGTTGSELVVNGTFTTDTTGWTASGATLAVVSSELELTNTGAAAGYADSDAFATVVGTAYLVGYTARRGTSSSIDIQVRKTTGGAETSVTLTNTSNVDGFLYFIASSTSTFIRVSANQAVLGRTGYFDNLSVKAAVETTVTVTSDWTRVATASATVTNPPLIIRMATSGDAIDVDLFQHELGAFITSPIPTVASQVTRLADQVSILTSAFGYNATESTLAVEYDAPLALGQDIVWIANGLAESLGLYIAVSSPILWTRDGGATQTAEPIGTMTGTVNKVAAAWKLNDFAGSLNGGAVATDATGTMPTPTELKLNPRGISGTVGNIHIKRLTYFPTRRTDADLQVLTRGDDLVWGAGDYLVWGSGNNLTW